MFEGGSMIDKIEKRCEIEGCGRLIVAKGLCCMHYGRIRAGIPNMQPNRITHMNMKEHNGMWKGNDVTLTNGRVRACHWFGIDKCEICSKPAMDRHHRDGNPINNDSSNIQCLCRSCHMRVDGRMDGLKEIQKQTPKRGENHPTAKLTFMQVIEIRKRYLEEKIFQYDLAKEHGVSQSLISAIVMRKIWKDIAI